MKCPHCGHFIPMELDQEPVRVPETKPPRWPLAKEFLALVQALDGNMIDATMVCLLIEDQQVGRRSSYSDLAERSDGAFKRSVVQKSIDRLVGRGLLEVGGPLPGRRVDHVAVQQILQSAATDLDALFLWLHEVAKGNFRDALGLALLVQSGADRRPVKMTGREAVRRAGGLYSLPREMLRGLRKVRRSKLLDIPEYRHWSVVSSRVNELLAQRAEAWLARGAPPAPWEAGLRFALSAGSIPVESAV